MEKPLLPLIFSFLLTFITLSFSVLAVDVSKTTGLSGDMNSSYASYSVNFGENYSSADTLCFDFTFVNDLLDPKDSLQYSLVPAPAPNAYGFTNIGSTPQSTRTSCITPAHTGFNEVLDGTLTGSVWMQTGNVTIQSLTIRLTNAVTTAPFNFSLSLNPASGTVTAGNSTTTTVSLTLTSGSTQSVSLSCSGLPIGAGCSFNPLSCNPACSSTATISTSSNTPTGTHAVTISGVDGGITRTSSYSLIVSSAPTTCPVCPSPPSWSTCVNNNQTRTAYKCDSTTNYICQSYTEKQSCTSVTQGSCQGYCGKKSAAGCWCDASCANYGDCCPDYKSVCASQPNVTTTPPPPTITPNATMQITITLPKTAYYPNENLEPKVTITDASGKLITDASIKTTITGPKALYPYFFYSTLCDCYKSSYWLDESTLIGDYTLTLEASHPNFLKTSSSKTFNVIKPIISTFSITADKREYSPGDKVTVTIKATDSFGNAIKDLYIAGEARDAATGRLVSAIYPYLSGDVYTYTYYPSSEDLGKSFKVVVSTKWKEKEVSAETTFSIVRRGLNADVALENNVLSPKDSLRGRIKVFDKDGKIVSDAYVSVNVLDPQGNYVRYLDAVYRDGFYEIKEWKVEDWVSVGNYSLEIKVDKHPEQITLEKQIEITKDRLSVDVILDKTSYKPGDQVFLKILVTYPDGTIAKDAWISAEIFPLVEQPFAKEERGFYQLSVCRIYPSPIPPVYYNGRFIQKYFIDNPYIPSECPTGKYALILKVSATGYADSEITKEFDVVLAKLFIETGFSVDSQPDSMNLALYADVKDENGNAVEYATIEGILRPPEEVKGCVKRFNLYYDSFLRRYVGNEFISRYECPDGNYVIQLRASSPSYETAEVVQGLTIQYKKGYEYRAYVPATPTQSFCREVSCGPNCIEKICESTTPIEECFNIIVDDECVSACTEDLEKMEREIGRGAEIGKGDFEGCINACTKKVSCQGAAIPVVPLEVMVEKLNELRKEVAETKEEVTGLKQLLLAIIDFVNSILSRYLGPQEAITVPSEVVQNATTNETNPVTGALASLIKSFAR